MVTCGKADKSIFYGKTLEHRKSGAAQKGRWARFKMANSKFEILRLLLLATKTAVFERKRQLFNFSLTFQIKRPCIFRMTTGSATDRETMGLRGRSAPQRPMLYFAGSPWSACQAALLPPILPGLRDFPLYRSASQLSQRRWMTWAMA